MKKYYSILICFFTISIVAQVIENPVYYSQEAVYEKLHDGHQFNGEVNEYVVAQYLRDEYLKNTEFELILGHFKESPSAKYFTYDILFQGNKVRGYIIKVIVNNDNRIIQLIKSLPDYPFLEYSSEFSYSKEIAEEYSDKKIASINSSYEWIYFQEEYILMEVVVILLEEGVHREYILTPDGEILSKRDLTMSHHLAGPDSLVSMLVYNPDPLTQAKVPYGGIYVDQNDSNQVILDPLRVQKFQIVNYTGSLLTLENDRVIIKEFSNPSYPIVTSNTGGFHFSRSHYGFEQVNAYYHLTSYQKYLQSLGYNLVNYQINVDAQAFDTLDNSQFNYGFNPPRLYFGTGGIDDAEDADVIIHEYGHAISHSANGTSNFGAERETLDEAIGDYFAASYSRSIRPFNWEKVYNWDGNTNFFPGRSVVNSSNKFYPNLVFSNIYQHTDLFSSALMEIWGVLGDTVTDKLVIESLYAYYINMKFPDAAMALVMSDSIQNNGKNFLYIWNAFHSRGILPSHPASILEHEMPFLKIFGTSSFASGGIAVVKSDREINGNWKLIDISGKIIEEEKVINKHEFSVHSKNLHPGIYLLSFVKESGVNQTFKLVRF